MTQVEKRSISLPPELAATIDKAVAAGEFSSASEVVREALRQWKERRDLLGHTVEELQMLWQEGVASGTAKPLTDAFAERIKQRGRARLAKAAEHT